jgi:hypothetical protein
MLIRLSALAAAVLATVALRPAPRPAQLYSFQTPTGNIGCMADNDGGRWQLRCDIGERDWRGASAGPDCDLDSGDALGLGATGRTYWVCHGPFTCTSARTGVTCRNRAQHGFMLSRASYRLF